LGGASPASASLADRGDWRDKGDAAMPRSFFRHQKVMASAACGIAWQAKFIFFFAIAPLSFRGAWEERASRPGAGRCRRWIDAGPIRAESRNRHLPSCA